MPSNMNLCESKQSFANIYEAMAWVMGQVSVLKRGEFRGGYVSKSGERKNIGYNFRRIEDYYAALNPLLAQAGIIYTQEFVAQTNEKGQQVFILEDRAQVNGLPGRNYRILVRSTFTHVSGTSLSTMYAGEAGGNDDKSLSKAQSVAYKVCMEKTFCIPVERTEDESAAPVEFSEEITQDKWERIYQPQYFSLVEERFDGDWLALKADMKRTLGINFDRISHLGEGHVAQYLRAARRRGTRKAQRDEAGPRQPDAGQEPALEAGVTEAAPPEAAAAPLEAAASAPAGLSAGGGPERGCGDEPDWMRGQEPASEPARPPARKERATDSSRAVLEKLLDGLCKATFNNNRSRMLADMRDFLGRNFSRIRDVGTEELSSYIYAQGESGRERRRQLLAGLEQVVREDFGGSRERMFRDLCQFSGRIVSGIDKFGNAELERYLKRMQENVVPRALEQALPGDFPAAAARSFRYGDEEIACGEGRP